MFTEKDRKRLNDAIKGNDYLSTSYQHINGWMRDKCDNLFDRAIKAETENANLKAKVDIYEKLLSKAMGSSDNKSDSTIIIDGDIYLLNDYTINVCDGRKTLSAYFECTTGITKDFKG